MGFEKGKRYIVTDGICNHIREVHKFKGCTCVALDSGEISCVVFDDPGMQQLNLMQAHNHNIGWHFGFNGFELVQDGDDNAS